jgi:glycosyltransferase involved in cell wall biosynthesis
VTVPVVAVVPAHQAERWVGATVAALRAVPMVGSVVVVDDGSTDATSGVAAAAGAEVVTLPVNRGKGGAVSAGLDRVGPPEAIVVLVDADTGATASAAELLLRPVVAGEADLAVAVLPPAQGRGGFGAVAALAGWLVRRACGLTVAAPLSGQRAAPLALLRGLDFAPRFGLEVAMTIDAVRAGARVVEVPCPFDHHHTGRTWRGFRHRAGQGIDVLRAGVPRLLRGWASRR